MSTFYLCHGATQAPLAETDYKERQRWRAADRDSCDKEGWKRRMRTSIEKESACYPHCVKLKQAKCAP